MQPAVQLTALTKRLKGKTIVDRLSFTVQPGEVFGFLGPNGAGKTTTIRMMVGLMSITSGEVTIGGLSVQRQYEQAIAQVGAIVENPEFYSFMTGYQNLQHFARMNQQRVDEARIAEAVHLVRLEERIDDKVRTYSLGMRQRLGVAQAILHRPSVLILDEPTNGLDPDGIRELRSYLRQLVETERLAVIVSSHLLAEMELLCDRVAIIQNGQLLAVRPCRQQAEAAIKVCFEVENAELAKEVVWEKLQLSAQVQEGQRVVLETVGGKEIVAKINAVLVAAGMQVYSIQHLTQTLEEQFLEVTHRHEEG